MAPLVCREVYYVILLHLTGILMVLECNMFNLFVSQLIRFSFLH